MAETFRYRAFLSYSHADTPTAMRVHQRLEGFRIDKDIVGRKTPIGPIPGTLRPIFRDRLEFDAGGSLADETIAALDGSAALILLASPHAARSKFVNEELRQFKLRYPDRPLIPLIVDGDPASDPEKECFPPALRFAVAEHPQHPVTIAKPFAVSKFELTFKEWDTCAAHGDCDRAVVDGGWGRGRQPVINVSWEDAQHYVAWLSRLTGKPYRLLSEAEYEYATRAGTTTVYPWGDELGDANANCYDCGGAWPENKQPAPVGIFTDNSFGLDDMVGNVWEWVEDCWHLGYEIKGAQGTVDAPADGSAWTSGDCTLRVLRGGSWNAGEVRSANRASASPSSQSYDVGFRVARTLNTR